MNNFLQRPEPSLAAKPETALMEHKALKSINSMPILGDSEAKAVPIETPIQIIPAIAKRESKATSQGDQMDTSLTEEAAASEAVDRFKIKFKSKLNPTKLFELVAVKPTEEVKAAVMTTTPHRQQVLAQRCANVNDLSEAEEEMDDAMSKQCTKALVEQQQESASKSPKNKVISKIISFAMVT